MIGTSGSVCFKGSGSVKGRSVKRRKFVPRPVPPPRIAFAGSSRPRYICRTFKKISSTAFLSLCSNSRYLFLLAKTGIHFHAKGSSGASLRLAYVDLWVQGYHFVKKVGSLKQIRRSTTPIYKGARVAV